MRYSIFFISFIMGVALCGGDVYAQLNGSQSDISVSIAPENPKPYEMVNASVTSYSINIDAATITWKINGQVKKSGRGEKTFEFSVGNINTTTTLEISAKTLDGQTITKTIKIKPTSVDLIWEAGGSVPPFYKGKSLFAHQNKITFIAIPHITSSNGTEYSAKGLIYKWKRNGSVIESASGYGQNAYTFVSPLISRGLKIEVDVTSPIGESAGYAFIFINPIEPEVILYKKSPLYGIEYERALTGDIVLDTSELTIVASPFFFGPLSSNNDILYKWSVNGSRTNSDTTQTTQVFRPKEGTSGTTNISLSLENANKILQSASTNFNLNFSNKVPGSISL